MDYEQTKYSQVLPGTIYYLGLHRPTINGLYRQMWRVDELQKKLLYGNFIYIVNLTEPLKNTKKYMKKTLEERTKFYHFAHMFN